jgi:hypothetical protein
MGDHDIGLAKGPEVDLLCVGGHEDDVREPGAARVALRLDQRAGIGIDADDPSDPRGEVKGQASGSRADVEDGPPGERLVGEPGDQRGRESGGAFAASGGAPASLRDVSPHPARLQTGVYTPRRETADA